MSLAEGLAPCYALSGCGGDDTWGGEAGFSCGTAQPAAALGSIYECNGYRLPTEAEWEYAARAGETHTYAGSNNVDDVAWYRGNSDDQTHPVGTKDANAWGLHDMSGNVWEWTWDWKGDYPTGSVTDPQGPSTGGSRVLRGGSFGFTADWTRAANRGWGSPDGANGVLGFRVVLPE